MELILSLGALLFGSIIGSFINALSFRFNTGRSVVAGRSRCMHCGHALSTLDLVPLFSYIFLRGHCRYCSARMSIQYPLVEGAMALISLLAYLVHPELAAYAFWLFVWAVLLFIVVYDMRHTVIPWSASLILGVLALLQLFVHFESGSIPFAIPSLLTFLSGPLLALPLAILSFVSGGRWMGWGDAPLQMSLGWLLGLTAGATALMLSFWIGASVGIILLVLKRGFTIKSELPFAPFLILGAFIAHFFHVDFFYTLPFLF